VLPHLEMLPKVWKHFWSNFDLGDGVKQSTGRSFCSILKLVGEAEAGSVGEQPAKE
jgi:hypothetical protein